VTVGEHVDVRMGHAPAVEGARALRELAVRQSPLGHQLTQSVTERLVANAACWHLS
jgi:hypothetical protein